jgi:hypothetical protein
MQFRVAIPENVKAGQNIRIRCPDGTEANVKVPKGLVSGDSFVFELAVDQLINPEALMETLKEKAPVTKPPPKKKGFLERDIVNINDLLLALAVGLIIGFGIIFGFVLGILYATRNVPPETPPVTSLQ